MRIDLNADVGEGSPEDERVIAAVSSVNVACGAHAGDAATIHATVRLARRAGAAIGAHPGYADRDAFGRRDLEMPADALEQTLVEQIEAVRRAAEVEGVELTHVKPHGALYNRAAQDPATAVVVARAVLVASPALVLVGLAGSPGLSVATAAGLRVAGEAFADRRYEPDGRLRDRRHPDATIDEPEDAAQQAVAIARERSVRSIDGSRVEVSAITICVHGDAPGAADRVHAVRRALEAAGVEIRPLAT